MGSRNVFLFPAFLTCVLLSGCRGINAVAPSDSTPVQSNRHQAEMILSLQKDGSEQSFLLDTASGSVSQGPVVPIAVQPIPGIADNLYGFDATTGRFVRYPVDQTGFIGAPISQSVSGPPTGDGWRIAGMNGQRYLYATQYVSTTTTYQVDGQNNVSGPTQSVPAPPFTQQILPDPLGRYIAVAQWQTCLEGNPPPPCGPPTPNQISIYLLDPITGAPAATPSSVFTGLPGNFYLEISSDGQYLWLSGPELDTFTVDTAGTIVEIDHQSFATGYPGLVFDPQRQFALGASGDLSMHLFAVSSDGVPQEVPSNANSVLTLTGNAVFDAYGEYVSTWTGPIGGRYYALFRFDRSTAQFNMVTKLPVTADFVAFLPLQ